MKLIAATLITLFFLSGKAHSIPIYDKGYRLPYESVEKNFTLLRIPLEEGPLAKHIVFVNYKVPKAQALEIAQNIIKVSRCFNLDPWIFTALINKESSFDSTATSPTGATGLTQFTRIGFKEVNDQLGMRGRVGAPEDISFYYNAIVLDCLDPTWQQLWNRVGVSEEDPQFYPLLKEEIKKDTLVALIYGAILLKTYVAHVNAKTTAAGIKLKTSETYYQALQIYNGEEGESKVHYAKKVFANLIAHYPVPLHFDFLDEKPIDE